MLLKMLHNCCNTAVLEVLLISISALSLGRCAPSGIVRIIISVKPLAAVLQYINGAISYLFALFKHVAIGAHLLYNYPIHP